MRNRILVFSLIFGLGALNLPRVVPCGPGAPAQVAPCCACPKTPVVKASCCCPSDPAPATSSPARSAALDAAPLFALLPPGTVALLPNPDGRPEISRHAAASTTDSAPPLFLLTGGFLS